MSTDRERLLQLFQAAVQAADPGRALASSLDEAGIDGTDRTWLLALGKAAPRMANAAVAWLSARGLEPAGGVVVAAEASEPPHAALTVVRGDHPLPGANSLHAAQALEDVVHRVQPRDEVWVLLSGGTSSLLASPVRGITPEELHDAYAVLLGSGLDIAAMNRVRKRISRWAGGRLAVALAHARVRVFVVSNVAGDNVASVGSGPCAPDPSTAINVRALLDEADLLERLPASVLDVLERTARRMLPETPKPADPAFRTVTTALIASNRVALDAAAAAARAAGLQVRVRRRPLSGDAARCGQAIARRLLEGERAEADAGGGAAEASPEQPVCYCAGGETVVTLEEGVDAGRGGRCQELALAAAGVLAQAVAPRVTLLAAGTDGRDGPTNAAGAVVDNSTWSRIQETGQDPATLLAAHDAYRALGAAGALIRTGPTGTNVMDVVLALVQPA